MAVKVLELHHHGIRVKPSETDKSLAFYRDVLGLTVDTGRPEIPGIPGYWMDCGNDTQIHIMGCEGTSRYANGPTQDPTTLATPLPPYKLTYVDGNITFNSQRPLEGTGILVVTGHLVVAAASNSVFNGLIYVRDGNVWTSVEEGAIYTMDPTVRHASVNWGHHPRTLLVVDIPDSDPDKSLT